MVKSKYKEFERDMTGFHAYRALFLKNLSYQKSQTGLNICQVVFVGLVMAALLGTFFWMNAQFGADTSYGYSGLHNYSYSGSTKTVVPSGDVYELSSWEFFAVTQDPGTDDLGELGNRTWSTNSGFLGSIPQEKQFSTSSYYSQYARMTNISSPNVRKFASQGEADQFAIDQFKLWNSLPYYPYNNTLHQSLAMQIPVASYIVHKWNRNQKELDVTIQSIPSSNGYYYYNWIPWSSDIQFNVLSPMQFFINHLSNALIRTLSDGKNITIQSISTELPYYYSSLGSVAMFKGILAMWFVPAALGFIFPMFVSGLIFEKTERLVEMMKMMGMKMTQYWAINFVFSLAMYLLLAVIVLVSCAITETPFTKGASGGYFVLLLLLSGPSTVAFSFFYSTFFSSVGIATKLGFFLSLVLAGGGPAIVMFVFSGQSISFWWLFIPQLAFQRGLFLLIYPVGGYAPPNFLSIGSGHLAQVFRMQVISTIVYLLLAKYLDDVLPREHGIRYSPFYPITSAYRFIRSKINKDSDYETVPLVTVDAATDDLESTIHEDPDVRAERGRVATSSKLLVKIVDLNKTYPPRGGQPAKLALERFTLGMEEGEALGLLGPNGAGKTTLISVLCGMTPPTKGDAWINKFDIRTNMSDVHSVLGYCPQHDILWPSLTVEEHLLFYTRLKGYPKDLETDHVAEVALRVGLSNDSLTKRVGQLSGGMKRRLSVAIANVGDSRLILLDEPTTGLDPESRRAIWDIIAANREGRSYIITTHNMEEADVLCSKIAIVSQGRMQCLGAPQYLKTKFGGGYVLNVSSFSQANSNQIIGFVKNMCPNAVLSSPNVAGGTTMEFSIPSSDVIMSRVFEQMEQAKEQLGVSEWAINQTSLEHVFMKIASNVES